MTEDQLESSDSSLKRSDTMATDDSSIQSMQDVQHSSPTKSPSSTEQTASERYPSSAQSRPGTSIGQTGRKRKVPDSVTPNACINCKKARAKCDGGTPSCKRCVHRNMRETCHYEVHTKTAKEQMIKEIRRLQRMNEDLEEEKDTLGEKNSWIEQIVRSLKDDGQGPEIISRLKRGEPHQKIAEWLGRPFVDGKGSGVDIHGLSPTTERNISEAISQYHQKLVNERDPRYWTNVTPEASFIEHLVNLYLTWIHPVHMLFNEDHFLASFRACVDVYCSPALVNAICAMSCCLLHDEQWAGDEQTTAGIGVIRDKFLHESKALMRDTENHKMTAKQTYAVMFLIELSSGHALIGACHLRLSTEMLLSKPTSEQSSESEEIAAWGILTLHTAWSGLTYQKPTAPISTIAKPFSNIDVSKQDGYWRFYRQPADVDVEHRQSFAIATASEHAKLFRIVHETILVYCGSRGRVTARALLDLYKRFLDWKGNLPPDLRVTESEPLPHILFLHMQYQVALVHLLQPLLHVDQFDPDSYKDLRSLVIRTARRGLELAQQYTELYTNHYLSPIQLFCLVHLCDTIVRYDSADHRGRTDCIRFCLICLEQAKVGFPVAGALQKMFRIALAEYDIPISDEMERHVGSSNRMGPEELLEACTRSSYRQPVSQVLPNLAPKIGQDFIEAFRQSFENMASEEAVGETSSAVARGKQKRVDIGALLNS